MKAMGEQLPPTNYNRRWSLYDGRYIPNQSPIDEDIPKEMVYQYAKYPKTPREKLIMSDLVSYALIHSRPKIIEEVADEDFAKDLETELVQAVIQAVELSYNDQERLKERLEMFNDKKPAALQIIDDIASIQVTNAETGQEEDLLNSDLRRKCEATIRLLALNELRAMPDLPA